MKKVIRKSILKSILMNIQDFNRVAQIDEMARRYLAMNTFDGILAILGVLVASFFVLLKGGIIEKNFIILTSLGVAIAIAVSGFYGTYLTERAERMHKIKKIEGMIGFKLRNSPVHRAHKFAMFILAVINCLSPLFIILIILIPFFAINNIITAYYGSFALAGISLFLVGVFLGMRSKENLTWAGVKMLIAGVVCTIIIFLVGGQ